MSFVHLHLHTEYSMLDGMNRIGPLMAKVAEHKMPAVAMTDHGVMYGATEFWLGAKDNGIKPILGCEIYLAPENRQRKSPVNGIKYYHLLLLAKNKIGYQNLNRIVSIAQVEGMYYKPRVDLEVLEKYKEGLICTSACLAGPISRHILRGEDKLAEKWLEDLHRIFGQDFYLEIQRNGFTNTDDWDESMRMKIASEHVGTVKQQMKVNTRLKEYSQKYKVKLITTTDAHFLDKSDSEMQEVLFAVKDGRQLGSEKARKGYLDTYVKTPDEMTAHFTDLPEIISNTNELAEAIEAYDIVYDRVQPHYVPEGKEIGKTSSELLRLQAFEGAIVAYGGVSKDLETRLNYELAIIHDKGYDDYFLVVSDIIKWARAQGIVVGVRGSVAGSVVAYCLDIINVEPLGWELYFERFLNPERPSPPDIDMDFQDDRRDEVVRYVEQKYGHDNVAAICAIGRMKTKAAIRDVSRVMGIDLKVADKLSKMVHVVFGKVKPIEKMVKEDPEFAALINSTPELQKLRQVVAKIEGMARHFSTHACGYLITPDPITNYVSVQVETGNTGKIVTQQEGVWIETLGLMKFDFLGLRNLTIIKNTIDLIEKYHDVKIDTKKIPLDDKKTFELFSRGDTIGVFQFESPPMQKYLRDLQPETLEDLCFMVSAYRPGPMQYIPDYIDCRHGRKQPHFVIPELEPILGKTFGFAIYQEQVIKIAVDIAGYSMGAADLLRRAMGKKKLDIMNKEAPIFKEGVKKLGYDQKIADQVWDYLLPFADYGFNKAHGASYALIAYWCAYLKANFPIEFMTGLMHSDISDSDRVAIDMTEARRMGFTILPPDINKSETYFTVEKGSYIRFGLGAVKNVGINLVEEIVKDRQKSGDYRHFADFVSRLLEHKSNKKAIECLVKIGALDQFGQRNQLLAVLPIVHSAAQNSKKHEVIGQSNLFGSKTETSTQIDKVELPKLTDVDVSEKIAWEKELIGSYITAHPLDSYGNLLLSGIFPLTAIERGEYLGRPVSEGGKFKFLTVLAAVKVVLTKTDQKPMAILTLEDQFAKYDAVVFTRAYEKLKEKLISGQVVIVEGVLNRRDDKLNIVVEEVYNPDQASSKDSFTVNICEVTDSVQLQKIKKCIADNKGGNYKLEVIYGDIYNPKRFVTAITASTDFISTMGAYFR